jgi:hypothetical protein
LYQEIREFFYVESYLKSKVAIELEEEVMLRLDGTLKEQNKKCGSHSDPYYYYYIAVSVKINEKY